MFFAEKIDVLGFGWMYEAILVMLFLVSAVDAVSIVKSLKSGGEELKEYAQLCIKYLKILMCIFAGGHKGDTRRSRRTSPAGRRRKPVAQAQIPQKG